MNQNRIVLSGTIVGQVKVKSTPDGAECAAAMFRFDAKSDDVQIVCYAERAQLLASLNKKLPLRVVGRLFISDKSHRAGILVDRLESSEPIAREAEQWNAERRFQGMAQIPGENRWASRPNWRSR